MHTSLHAISERLSPFRILYSLSAIILSVVCKVQTRHSTQFRKLFIKKKNTRKTVRNNVKYLENLENFNTIL